VSFPGALVISSLSCQYVVVPVTAEDNGSIYNPTSDVVQLAFTVGYGVKPGDSDWLAGEWDDNPVQGIYYNAKVLIGPGANVLAPGTYTSWIKITDNPQIPVKQCGTVIIQLSRHLAGDLSECVCYLAKQFYRGDIGYLAMFRVGRDLVSYQLKPAELFIHLVVQILVPVCSRRLIGPVIRLG
jgi:hypothetical protein